MTSAWRERTAGQPRQPRPRPQSAGQRTRVAADLICALGGHRPGNLNRLIAVVRKGSALEHNPLATLLGSWGPAAA